MNCQLAATKSFHCTANCSPVFTGWNFNVDDDVAGQNGHGEVFGLMTRSSPRNPVNFRAILTA